MTPSERPRAPASRRSARGTPCTRGRQIASRISAPRPTRSAEVPAGPRSSNSVAASAAPNWTDDAAPSTISGAGTRAPRPPAGAALAASLTSLFGGRQPEPETTPAGRGIRDADCPGMPRDDSSADRQTQAGPGGVPPADLCERLEDPLALLGRHAGAVVDHVDPPVPALFALGDHHHLGTVRVRILDGVGEQVLEDLLHALHVGNHRRLGRDRRA